MQYVNQAMQYVNQAMQSVNQATTHNHRLKLFIYLFIKGTEE